MYVYATKRWTESHQNARKSVVKQRVSLALSVPNAFGDMLVMERAQMFHKMVSTRKANGTLAHTTFDRAVHRLRRMHAYFMSFDVCAASERPATFLAFEGLHGPIIHREKRRR